MTDKERKTKWKDKREGVPEPFDWSDPQPNQRIEEIRERAGRFYDQERRNGCGEVALLPDLQDLLAGYDKARKEADEGYIRGHAYIDLLEKQNEDLQSENTTLRERVKELEGELDLAYDSAKEDRA